MNVQFGNIGDSMMRAFGDVLGPSVTAFRVGIVGAAPTLSVALFLSFGAALPLRCGAVKRAILRAQQGDDTFQLRMELLTLTSYPWYAQLEPLEVDYIQEDDFRLLHKFKALKNVSFYFEHPEAMTLCDGLDMFYSHCTLQTLNRNGWFYQYEKATQTLFSCCCIRFVSCQAWRFCTWARSQLLTSAAVWRSSGRG